MSPLHEWELITMNYQTNLICVPSTYISILLQIFDSARSPPNSKHTLFNLQHQWKSKEEHSFLCNFVANQQSFIRIKWHLNNRLIAIILLESHANGAFHLVSKNKLIWNATGSLLDVMYKMVAKVEDTLEVTCTVMNDISSADDTMIIKLNSEYCY